MRKRIAKKIIVTATLTSMVAATSMASAATMGRIIPSGSVTFHKNDQVIAKYIDQAPINDSALMTCEQACSVKLPTMSLKVADDTTFAVRNNDGVMNLYVKKGLVSFSVDNITQQVSFYTPDGRYVKSEGFIAPTSTENAVKGFMNVSESQAQIGIKQGGMILATADGVQTIDSGYTYNVDLNELPATGAPGAGPAGFSLFGLGTAASVGVVTAGVVGAGFAVDAATDDDDNPASPNQ